MLLRMQLINFQSHCDTTIDFCEGVNAIIGLSDSGKSAVLRAITWAVTNKPSGNAFVSTWATEKGAATEAIVTLSNGIVITRGRTKSDNYYKLEQDGEVLEFRAFGQDVPEEIRAAFNLGDVNLQAQLDSPFLLAASPGEVAQTLNRIVNLDVIDKAVSSIRKKKMSTDQDLRTQEVHLVELAETAKDFDYLANMEKEIVELEVIHSAVGTKKQQHKQLQALIGQQKQLAEGLKQAESILAAEPAVAKAEKLNARVVELRSTKASLSQILQRITETVAKIEAVPDYEGAVELIDVIVEAQHRVRVKKQHNKDLDALLDSIDNQTDKTVKLKETLEKLHLQVPEVCPLCGK